MVTLETRAVRVDTRAMCLPPPRGSRRGEGLSGPEPLSMVRSPKSRAARSSLGGDRGLPKVAVVVSGQGRKVFSSGFDVRLQQTPRLSACWVHLVRIEAFSRVVGAPRGSYPRPVEHTESTAGPGNRLGSREVVVLPWWHGMSGVLHLAQRSHRLDVGRRIVARR